MSFFFKLGHLGAASEESTSAKGSSSSQSPASKVPDQPVDPTKPTSIPSHISSSPASPPPSKNGPQNSQQPKDSFQTAANTFVSWAKTGFTSPEAVKPSAVSTAVPGGADRLQRGDPKQPEPLLPTSSSQSPPSAPAEKLRSTPKTCTINPDVPYTRKDAEKIGLRYVNGRIMVMGFPGNHNPGVHLPSVEERLQRRSDASSSSVEDVVTNPTSPKLSSGSSAQKKFASKLSDGRRAFFQAFGIREGKQRSQLELVSDYLHTNHGGGHHLVVNLSETEYELLNPNVSNASHRSQSQADSFSWSAIRQRWSESSSRKHSAAESSPESLQSHKDGMQSQEAVSKAPHTAPLQGMQGQVVQFRCPGYPSPPLAMLGELCLLLDAWLSAHPKNVVAIHGQDDRGRVVVFLAVWSIWCSGRRGFLPLGLHPETRAAHAANNRENLDDNEDLASLLKRLLPSLSPEPVLRSLSSSIYAQTPASQLIIPTQFRYIKYFHRLLLGHSQHLIARLHKEAESTRRKHGICDSGLDEISFEDNPESAPGEATVSEVMPFWGRQLRLQKVILRGIPAFERIMDPDEYPVVLTRQQQRTPEASGLDQKEGGLPGSPHTPRKDDFVIGQEDDFVGIVAMPKASPLVQPGKTAAVASSLIDSEEHGEVAAEPSDKLVFVAQTPEQRRQLQRQQPHQSSISGPTMRAARCRPYLQIFRHTQLLHASAPISAPVTPPAEDEANQEPSKGTKSQMWFSGVHVSQSAGSEQAPGTRSGGGFSSLQPQHLQHQLQAYKQKDLLQLKTLPVSNEDNPEILLEGTSYSFQPSTAADSERRRRVVDREIVFDMDLPLEGDILLRLRHVSARDRRRVTMLRFGFHTGFVEPGRVRYKRGSLDGACNDDRFPRDFSLDLVFSHEAKPSGSAAEPEDASSNPWQQLSLRRLKHTTARRSVAERVIREVDLEFERRAASDLASDDAEVEEVDGRRFAEVRAEDHESQELDDLALLLPPPHDNHDEALILSRAKLKALQIRQRELRVTRLREAEEQARKEQLQVKAERTRQWESQQHESEAMELPVQGDLDQSLTPDFTPAEQKVLDDSLLRDEPNSDGDIDLADLEALLNDAGVDVSTADGEDHDLDDDAILRELQESMTQVGSSADSHEDSQPDDGAEDLSAVLLSELKSLEDLP